MRQVKHTLKPHYLPIFYIPVRVIRLYDIQTSSAQCHVPNFPKLFACTGHLPIMDFVVSIHALISFFRIPVGRKSSGVFYLHTVIINGYAHRTSVFFVRPMLKNGVPSEVTLCRVEHGIDNVWKGPPFRWYLSLFKAVLPTIHYYILYRTSIFDCCFRQKEA